jgi:lipopolysaccharide transport system permease protein
MAALGLGIGLIISSLTTKYRDLRFLIQFGIQLAMYATPIVWPLSILDESVQWKLMINPMTSIVETFKVAFFGTDFGVFNWSGLGYSFLFAIAVLFLGLKLFTRVEKSFMDTI